MEKEEKGKNQNQSETSNQNQSQNNEQQSFLGAASFTKEGAVGSNPTPPHKK
jgi:5-deoxy-D-glucuronate isomerase